MFYIGVDLGTSSVKLLLMDAGGKVCKIVSREYPLFLPKPGWSEQNPKDWYEKTVEGIRELVEGYKAEEIGGISFGGQMHGLVVLDEEDNVLRPAILWNDSRSVDECRYLNEEIGKDFLTEHTANIAFPGFTAPKVLWMKEHEPDLFKRIAKIMLPKDYLVYRFTGVFSTDFSDASGTLLLDVKKRKWSEEMCRICGVKRECLPRLFESYEKVGNLKEDVAGKLHLSPDCIVAAGAGDNAAAAIGTGTVGEGKCNLSLGTSGTVFISSERFGVDHNHALHSFAHGDGAYHLMGCMLSAASCNKWWMEEVLHTTEYEKEQERIKNLGENKVFFLPYLMGERSPHNDPYARGVFFGMSMDTSREDMTQAVLEGVAFALRDSLEVARRLRIRIEKATICGGGGKSRLWKEILANVMNLELESVASEEGPALGGAVLAAVANKEYSSVEEACRNIVKVVDSVKPQKELVEKYNHKYEQFIQIYPACKEIYQIINE